MNIFFIGQIIPTKLINKEYEKLHKLCNNAANVFYNALLTGLTQNGCKVSAISTVTSDTVIGSIDCPYNCIYNVSDLGIVKHIKLALKTYTQLSKWYKRNQGEKSVIFNCLRAVQACTGLVFCKFHRIKSIAVVTDVPGYRTVKRENMTFSARCIDSFVRYMLSKYDGYILLSEEMKNILPIGEKKYIVLEGICTDKSPYEPMKKNDTFTIMYAGSLMRKYNIMGLVEAVINLNRNDVVLKLFGNGELESELEEISDKYSCIQYCGSVSNEVCIEEQKKAHLLVNPRFSSEEYTKYSFPSKNIEYMKSGTPVLYTKLPSMPKEYYGYINIIEDETAKGIESALKKILETNYKELTDKAEKAKEFVETKKSATVQAAGVMDLIDCIGDIKFE